MGSTRQSASSRRRSGTVPARARASSETASGRKSGATPQSAAEAEGERASALDKVLAILDVLTSEPHAVTVPELVQRTGMPRQTAHRVLRSLLARGLAIRSTQRDRFGVGPRLNRLALSAIRNTAQGALVRSILQGIVDDVGETCNVGVLDGLDFIYIERIECHWSLRVHLTAGSRVPAWCTSGGKALLAHADRELTEALLARAPLTAFTPTTLAGLDELRPELARIRRQGFALNDEEYTVGIVGVAVPVLDHTGRAMAGLALHGPAPRLDLDKARSHVARLQRGARELAVAFGIALRS